MGRILWIIIVALFVFWLLGLALKIGGGLIHYLLVVAGIIFVIQLITGKRSVDNERDTDFLVSSFVIGIPIYL